MANTHRPASTEYLDYYERYISLVPEDVAIAEILTTQRDEFLGMYRGVSEEQSAFRYAPEKWSIKQVLGHLSDTERVFSFRGLSVSRGEKNPLPSFEQDEYMAGSNFDDRPFAAIVDEFAAVRSATILLYAGMSDAMLRRTGIIWKGAVSSRACGFMIAGHERYHVALLRERYGVGA